jgi:hypothetical protein
LTSGLSTALVRVVGHKKKVRYKPLLNHIEESNMSKELFFERIADVVSGNTKISISEELDCDPIALKKLITETKLKHIEAIIDEYKRFFSFPEHLS